MASYCAPLIEPAVPAVVLWGAVVIEVYIWPVATPAISFVPSEEATDCRYLFDSYAIYVAPESNDKNHACRDSTESGSGI